MRYTVREIFPTPIYESTIDSGILSEHQDELVSICEKYITNNYSSNHEVDYDRRHILDKFPKLKNHLQSHLDVFCNNIIGEHNKFKLNITTSWCVGLRPGTSQQVHQHENSIVSGVMYFMNDDNVSDISFIRDNSVAFNPNMNLNPSTPTKFTYRESRFTPKNGAVILFPAHVRHKVLENTSNSIRNCLAFDSFVTGVIGDRRTLLQL